MAYWRSGQEFWQTKRVMVRRVGVMVIIILMGLGTSEVLRAGLINLTELNLNKAWVQGFAEGGFESCRQDNVASTVGKELLGIIDRSFPYVPSNNTVGHALWLSGRCSEAVNVWYQALGLPSQQAGAALGLVIAGRANMVPQNILAVMAEYAYQTGMVARAHDKPDEGAIWYSRSLELLPQIKTAQELARLYREQGQIESARGVWKRTVDISPASMPDHWWATGQLAELDSDWLSAARDYHRGADLAREPFDYWMREGQMYQKLSAWAEAESAFQRARAASPTDWRPMWALGNLAEQQSKYDDAIHWYLLAEAIDPLSIDVLYGLGHTYFLQRNDPLAQAYLKRALEVSPSYTWTAYYLAQSLYRSGNQTEALEYLEKAIRWYPGNPWDWAVQLGDWRRDSRDCVGAKEAYQKAQLFGADESEITDRLRSLTSSCP